MFTFWWIWSYSDIVRTELLICKLFFVSPLPSQYLEFWEWFNLKCWFLIVWMPHRTQIPRQHIHYLVWLLIWAFLWLFASYHIGVYSIILYYEIEIFIEFPVKKAFWIYSFCSFSFILYRCFVQIYSLIFASITSYIPSVVYFQNNSMGSCFFFFNQNC